MSDKPSTPAGRVEIDGDRATLVFERRLAHPPEAVWRAITDPEALATWYMAKARIDGRPGGSVEMVTGPSRFEWTGRILTWDPPRVFEYEWKTGKHDHLPQGEDTVVRYELAPDGAGTRLVLTHRNLTKGTALGFAPGTHALLDRLDAHLAGEPLPNWMERYAAVKDAYPSWQR